MTLAAFDPQRMADSSCHEVNRTHFRGILKHMIEAGRISETVQQQNTVFLAEVIKQSSQFATFNPTGSSTQERDQVDSLFCNSMSHNQSCKQLWTKVSGRVSLSGISATCAVPCRAR